MQTAITTLRKHFLYSGKQINVRKYFLTAQNLKKFGFSHPSLSESFLLYSQKFPGKALGLGHRDILNPIDSREPIK